MVFRIVLAPKFYVGLMHLVMVSREYMVLEYSRASHDCAPRVALNNWSQNLGIYFRCPFVSSIEGIYIYRIFLYWWCFVRKLYVGCVKIFYLLFVLNRILYM
jgi:hypothetical protein